jgi:hypothetical protein
MPMETWSAPRIAFPSQQMANHVLQGREKPRQATRTKREKKNSGAERPVSPHPGEHQTTILGRSSDSPSSSFGAFPRKLHAVAYTEIVRPTAAGAVPECPRMAMRAFTGFPFHPPRGRGARHPERATLYALLRILASSVNHSGHNQKWRLSDRCPLFMRLLGHGRSGRPGILAWHERFYFRRQETGNSKTDRCFLSPASRLLSPVERCRVLDGPMSGRYARPTPAWSAFFSSNECRTSVAISRRPSLSRPSGHPLPRAG